MIDFFIQAFERAFYKLEQLLIIVGGVQL